MFKAIIFDMDGVLIDSHQYIWYSFREVLAEEGITFSDEDIKRYLGHSLSGQMEMWKKEHGLRSDYAVEDFSKKSSLIQMALMEEKHKHDHHVHTFIKHAKEEGLKLAVATNSSRARAERMLAFLGIKEEFEVIMTASDTDKHKPDPDMFLKTAQLLGVQPAECIVIEDAANGIQGAKDAGMKAVAMVTEMHTKEELEHAHDVINDFSEVDMQRLFALYKKV